jgi:outer membrane immunogenic protein
MRRPLLGAHAGLGAVGLGALGLSALGIGAAGLGAWASTGLALAADLPAPAYRAPVAAPAPVVDWTGYYVGGDIGYALGRDLDHEVAANGAPSAFSPAGAATTKGVVAGGFVGYNLQVSGPLVVGIEGDLEWTNLKGSANFTKAAASTYQSSINAEGSIRGRIGYAFDHALFYATGGLALADTTEHYVANGPPAAGAFIDVFSQRLGWTVGAGVDYMFAPNWIGRAEYRYSDFGTFTTNPSVLPGFTESHRITENEARLGFAYKFGSYAPVVTKY